MRMKTPQLLAAALRGALAFAATGAQAYGDQTETDHASLVEAIESGRVKTLEGI